MIRFTSPRSGIAHTPFKDPQSFACSGSQNRGSVKTYLSSIVFLNIGTFYQVPGNANHIGIIGIEGKIAHILLK